LSKSVSSPDVVVMGLGNLLMQDEGVGIHALRSLQEQYQFEPDVQLIDGGTSGMDLLPYFRPDSYVLLIDAMNFSETPGEIGRVEGDDIMARLNTKMSVHHLGLSDLLSTVKLLDIEPADLVLIGVQPETIELFLGLSPKLEAVIPKIVQYAVEQLEKWGVKVSPLEF